MDLDYAPLSSHIGFKDRWVSLKTTIAKQSTLSVILLILMVIIFGGVGLLISISALQGPSAGTFLTVNLPIAIVVIIAVFALILYSQTDNIHMARFIADNQLSTVTFDQQNEPGLMFTQGRDRSYTLGFAIPQAHDLQIANYEYTEGSGKNSKTYERGIIRCTLKNKLPNVFLDATSNNMLGFSNFSQLKNNQQLSMEGDFDKYFKVYAPADYQTDTLYWLTPELMQLLKDHMSTYDIEIIGNYIYAYSSTKFLFNAKSVANLIQTGRWLQAEFEQNTDRYADSRAAVKGTVAQSGQKLKRGLPIATVVTIVFFILYFILMLLTGH